MTKERLITLADKHLNQLLREAKNPLEVIVIANLIDKFAYESVMKYKDLKAEQRLWVKERD